MSTTPLSTASRKRLAIIGAGSSGLVTLKYALDRLPGWEVRCYDAGRSISGAWGDPAPGFVSTSTKYTTQFACFRRFDAAITPGGRAQAQEFYRNAEFGDYLRAFAAEFRLEEFIDFEAPVSRVERAGDAWAVTVRGAAERFDAVAVCTGLVAAAKPCDLDLPVAALPPGGPLPNGHRIVVIGGGESAVDYAVRLADPRLCNTVFLSLRGGVRVSPRYHPIAGVPSDFLRNRLLMSVHEDLRNAIGERFVRARMRYEEIFERIFPPKDPASRIASLQERKKYWSLLLTERAKDRLFNMFHNKSDTFLDLVAGGQIQIVGEALDRTGRIFARYDSTGTVRVDAEQVLPAIGYRSTLSELCGGQVTADQLYLGCVHSVLPGLFAVGFARPIIGNIPSISEMQAQLVTAVLAGTVRLPDDIRERCARDAGLLRKMFPTLNTLGMYPVEMIPYCDCLARMMDHYPSVQHVGSLRRWLRLQLAPASTLQYTNEFFDREFHDRQPIYAPVLITALLLGVKCFDLPYRMGRKLMGTERMH